MLNILRNIQRKYIFLLIAVVYLLFVVYYLPMNVSIFLTYIFNILSVCILFLIFYGIGCKIFTLLKFTFFSFSQEIVFSIGLGIAIIAYLTFGLGLLGLLYKGVFYPILVSVLIFTYTEIIELLKRLRNIKVKPISDIFKLVLITFLIVWVVFFLIHALCPVWEMDEQRAYVSIAKEFAQIHQIRFLPNLMWGSSGPLLIEMIFTLGLLLINTASPYLISFGLLMVSLLSIYSFCKRLINSQTALLSVVLFITMPLLFFAQLGKSRIGTIFFTILAIYSLFIWMQNLAKKEWLFLSAIFWGVCMGIQYTSILTFLMVCPLVLFRLLSNAEVKFTKTTKLFFKFLFVALIIAAPWYIRNILITGSPVFPFAMKLFRPNSSVWNSYLAERQSSFGSFSLGKNFMLLPISFLTLFKGYFFPVIFVPFIIFSKKLSSSQRYLIFYTLSSTVIFLLFRSDAYRFLLPLFPFWAIISAYSIEFLSVKGYILKYAVYSIIFISLLYPQYKPTRGYVTMENVYNHTVKRFIPAVFLGKREEFLRKYCWGYEICQYINKNLPKSSKILFGYDFVQFHSNVPIYCPQTSVVGSTIFTSKSMNEMLLKLEKYDITHFVQVAELTKGKDAKSIIYKEENLNKYFEPIIEIGIFKLYRIRYEQIKRIN